MDCSRMSCACESALNGALRLAWRRHIVAVKKGVTGRKWQSVARGVSVVVRDRSLGMGWRCEAGLTFEAQC